MKPFRICAVLGIVVFSLWSNPVFAELFNIPPGPLEQTLDRYAKTTGQNLVYMDSLVEGRNSPGVKGNLSPTQAMDKILAGTGLSFTHTSQGDIVLQKDTISSSPAPQKQLTQKKNTAAVVQSRPMELDQIVVTATKTEEKIHDIPASLSIVYGDEIQAAGIRNIVDYLYQVPGIQIEDTAGSGVNSMMTMRGMPQANSQYILVLVDGIPQNTTTGIVRWAGIPVEMIDRVEIVRGPASALYGMNALGGVINIRTKNPVQDEKSVSAGYGSHEENKEKAYFSKNYGKTGVSIGVLRHAAEGGFKNSAFEKYHFYGKLFHEFNQNTDLDFSLFYSDWNNEWRGGVTFKEWDEGKREPDQAAHMKEIHAEPTAVLVLNHRFNDQWKLTNRLFMRTIDNEWRDLMDLLSDDSTSNQIGNEIQAEFDHDFFHRNNKIIAGFLFDYGDLDFERKYSQYFRLPEKRGTKWASVEIARRVYSAYIQDIFQVTPDITFTTGARYDYADYDVENKMDETRSGKNAVDHFSPKVGITYSPVKNLNLFTNIGVGFKPPSGGQIALYNDLKPEKATNYEIGLRTNIYDKLNFQAAYYYTTLKDQIVYVVDPSLSIGGIPTNAGESKMYGFELEGTYFIFDSLSLFASYTHNTSEYTDYRDAWKGDLSGNDMAWQPDNKITAGIRYIHPSGFSAMLTTKWVDEQYLSGLNEHKMDSYTTTDLKIAYAYQHNYKFSLSVRNLFDENYASYGEYYDRMVAGDRISVFAEVTYQF